MNLSLRPLLLATGALLLTAAPASAQFIELVTEAPVTLQAVLTTAAITSTETQRKSVTSKLTQAAFLEELRISGLIPTPTISGWRLVAANYAPADVAFVNGAFQLYVVNPDYPSEPGTRILVPVEKFRTTPYQQAGKYTERHQGQYIYSSKGTITNHVRYSFLTDFSVGTNSYTMQSSLLDGFATINFTSKDFDGDQEVFFYAISSAKCVALGSFITGDPNPDDPTSPQGLISLTVNIGAAHLVARSLYPEVEFYPEFSDEE